MEYQINRADPTKSEPVLYHWYKDNDGDLFVYVGDDNHGEPDNGYPWLDVLSNNGAVTRSTSYPAEPLTELSPEQIETAVNYKTGTR